MLRIENKNNEILVILIKPDDWSKGLDFITSDDKYLQVGTWWYDKGKVLDRHHHDKANRSSDLTQECVSIMHGSMLVKVYDYDKNFLKKFTMDQGDFAVFLGGGHEYTILENDTRIIETKNGPFLGVEIDKTRF